MASTSAKYVIITPVKNEEEHLEKTIRSVTGQAVKPLLWVIVDDGSTDSTPSILDRYSSHYPWIKVKRLENEPRARGGRVVKLFYEGLEEIRDCNYEFIVKLDGDVSFSRDFFEKIFLEFSRDPDLGISSGISHVLVGDDLVEERSSKNHTLGATKVYRKKCFDAIGGLVEAMGWDGIDEIKARMNGWEARPVEGLTVLHHRPEGAAHGIFSSGVQRGRGSYFMGYHPLFLIIRAIKRMSGPPLFLDGFGMLVGFFGALFRKEKQIDDMEFIDFLRKNQLRKLLFKKNRI